MSCKRNGFSLIEVMVSLVILVIGLIGIFNLHIMSKQGSFESFQQTQASYFANDIINRMRLNVSELSNYGSSSGTHYSGESLTKPTECSGVYRCSNTELRAWDLYEWQSAFIGDSEVDSDGSIGGLPSPTACVYVNSNDVVIVMTWKSVRKFNGANENYSDEVKSCDSSGATRRVFEIKTAIF
ncbi:type IV pilus modification protein PilV [Shewanella sp. SR44-4]|uniref:type IV pilus modification protein PilV n=1 Tax=Shewanella sp. SR44-4 TaxID=2760935 RepID=UPI00160046EB|nr:type IV pilus modification protein PilV [Shewanella sp. SR44-4]MBB1363743.1 type IV pilus modification protein PilV [Shewanella sp. SR44-4]